MRAIAFAIMFAGAAIARSIRVINKEEDSESKRKANIVNFGMFGILLLLIIFGL